MTLGGTALPASNVFSQGGSCEGKCQGGAFHGEMHYCKIGISMSGFLLGELEE